MEEFRGEMVRGCLLSPFLSLCGVLCDMSGILTDGPGTEVSLRKAGTTRLRWRKRAAKPNPIHLCRPTGANPEGPRIMKARVIGPREQIQTLIPWAREDWGMQRTTTTMTITDPAFQLDTECR